MGKLDWYIIRKFLGTFVFITALFVLIGIVIDITEKMEDFIETNAPLQQIIFQYYLNFIPYIIALLGPFFIFISVIWFTSRMTYNSEIVSIIGNGISFYRMLRPYVAGSILLAFGLWLGNNYIVPLANKQRIAFLDDYVHSKVNHLMDINLTSEKFADGETNIFLHRYSNSANEGYQFVMNKIEDHRVKYTLRANKISWDSTQGIWKIPVYEIWHPGDSIDGWKQKRNLDTNLAFTPADFHHRHEFKETMTTPELNKFIQHEKLKGSENIPSYLIEKYQRTSNAFAVIILSFIGVAFSTRKVRGGIGLQLALGLLISTAFILFLRFATTFATNSNLPAIIAVWLPNIGFGVLAYYLVRIAPK